MKGAAGGRGVGLGLGGLDFGVEDSDGGPVGFLAVDEGEVAFGGLVGVVGGAGFEDGVEGDLEVLVVDGAVVAFGQTAAGEEREAVVAGEVLAAVGQQRLDGVVGGVGEREVNVVGDHGGFGALRLARSDCKV